MTRDDIILAYCKLRAHGCAARELLLDHAAQSPSGQRAAYVREVKAVAKLYAELRPAPKPQAERPPAEDRKSRMTHRERMAWRRYESEFADRLARMRGC